MRTLTDITAVADVFCAGNISAAQTLLSSDPSRWPYAECYAVLALKLSPGSPQDRTVLPHGTPFGLYPVRSCLMARPPLSLKANSLQLLMGAARTLPPSL